MKLRFKFGIMLLLLPILLLTVIGAFTFLSQRQSLYEREREKQQILSAEITNQLYRYVAEKKQILKDMARLPVVIDMAESMPDTVNREDYEQNPHFADFQKIASVFLSEDTVDYVFMGSENSRYWITDYWEQLGEDYNTKEKNWYNEAVAINGLYCSPPYAPSNAPDTRVVTMTYPVRKGGKIVGVIGIDMGMKEVIAYLREKTEDSRAVLSLHSTLTDGNKYLYIYHPLYSMEEENQIVSYFTDMGVSEDDFSSFSESIYSHDPVQLEYRDGKGERKSIIKQMIPETSWALMIEFSIDEIYGNLSRETIRSILFIMVSLVALLALILFLLDRTVIEIYHPGFIEPGEHIKSRRGSDGRNDSALP